VGKSMYEVFWAPETRNPSEFLRVGPEKVRGSVKLGWHLDEDLDEGAPGRGLPMPSSNPISPFFTVH